MTPRLTALTVLAALAAAPAAAPAQCRTASCGPAYVSTGFGHGYVSTGYGHVGAVTVPYADPYALVIGRAFPVYLPLQSYASVGDDAREYLKVKNATRDGLLEALQIANGGGAGTGPVGPADPRPPQVPAAGAGPAVPHPPAAAAAAAGAPRNLSPQAIVTARCAECHNPKEPKRLDLTRPLDQLTCAEVGWCHAKVVNESMPKNGKLPQAEFDLLNDYIEKRLAAEVAKARAGK